MQPPSAAMPWNRVTTWCLSAVAGLGILLSANSSAQAQRSALDSGIPTQTYHAAFRLFYDGEYEDALDIYQQELRSAMRVGTNRWVDSICYYTMIGECYYHMGKLDAAMEAYTAAVQLILAYPQWMNRIQFPAQPRPMSLASLNRTVPWVTRTRQTTFGQFPTRVGVMVGYVEQEGILEHGGVVQRAHQIPVEVTEIFRCKTLAIRRRTELLGPLAQFDGTTRELVAYLSRRPGPPNHWSQSWVDVQLGLALLAAGKHSEAISTLTRSTTAMGRFEHPLSAVALLELGKLALERGDYQAAQKFLEEASVDAVVYSDPGIIEESLRNAALAYMLNNNERVYPVLAPAMTWARIKRLTHLQASLVLAAAENGLHVGSTGQASRWLNDAQNLLARRTMSGGRLGAKWQYLTAVVAYRSGRFSEGESALGAALGYMQEGGVWLYHIRRMRAAFSGGRITVRGPITPRTAVDLYEYLLRDPTGGDWARQPLESLSVVTSSQHAAFEQWFRVTMERRDTEKAIEVADRTRQHRFLMSLPLGGRLAALRGILETPEGQLPPRARLQRQDLLTKYPQYRQLAQQATEIRRELADMAPVPGDDQQRQQLERALESLTSSAAQQEAILRQMSLERNAAMNLFPPVVPTEEIQERLPEGHAVLSFFAAGSDLYGFLLNRNRYAAWRVPTSAVLGREIGSYLQALGLTDGNREFSSGELTDAQWKTAGKKLAEVLLASSPVDLAADFPELVIVPDGLTWYVPFEALTVGEGDEMAPLIARHRVRYAPTTSLAVTYGPGVKPRGYTGVILGRLYPRDDPAVARAAFEKLAEVVPQSVALEQTAFRVPGPVYATLFSQMIVLDDLQNGERGPLDWVPVPIDRNRSGNSLADWLKLPWKKPQVMILPGFHTPAEGALRRGISDPPGSEMFLSVCGLMAGGTRTVVLSRWRTGGEVVVGQVREFGQELPHAPAADAMQRAILLAAESVVNPDSEPRVKSRANAGEVKAEHPFFWADLMLFDSGVPVSGMEDEPLPAPEAPVQPAEAEGHEAAGEDEEALPVEAPAEPPAEGVPNEPLEREEPPERDRPAPLDDLPNLDNPLVPMD